MSTFTLGVSLSLSAGHPPCVLFSSIMYVIRTERYNNCARWCGELSSGVQFSEINIPEYLHAAAAAAADPLSNYCIFYILAN